VVSSASAENLDPDVFGIAEHGGNELAAAVLGRAGAPRRLPVRLLVLRATAAQDLGAADENTGIDAEHSADQAEH
jgi:hypothetical protein